MSDPSYSYIPDNPQVTKSSGIVMPYIKEKLIDSLRRAGATGDTITRILERIDQELSEKPLSTGKIYKMAFRMLKRQGTHVAARYHLKNALMELGPSGFPFERFIAKLMEEDGFKTEVGVFIEGQCVTHEVDVFARRDGQTVFVECKYHNDNARKNDIKTTLYVHARFMDIEKRWKQQDGRKEENLKGWLVSNTGFTDDSIQYARCSGLVLLGWDYPFDRNLRSRIDREGLHPLTCLTTLTTPEKQYILEKGLVLCRDLPNHHGILQSAGLNNVRIQKVLSEAERLTTGK